jgi:hypothetical protein
MNAIVCSAVVLALTLSSCELFVVGSSAPRRAIIERSQRSSVGVVHLWSAELDSSSTTAATELMVHSSGRKLLAVEKYELTDELARWKRLLSGKPITSWTTDTTTASMHVIDAVYDHLRTVRFTTIAVDNVWYISRVDNPQAR